MTFNELRADPDSDQHVVGEILASLNASPPKSFFLYAGAGAGKTKTLVDVLHQLKQERHHGMRLKGQQIAVITYTNGACDEITQRMEYNGLFDVRTIHSFVWSLIQGFNDDIRHWMAGHLERKVIDLLEKQKKGRKNSKRSADRAREIEATNARRAQLDEIKIFSYSPTSDNRERESLSHPEVIEAAASLIKHKPLMRELLVSKYPIVLVDESQDTNKHLVDALLAVQAEQHTRFAIGLIGDTMQRIYNDGKADLADAIPAKWATPRMSMNHRCPARVVQLVNRIRQDVDTHQQRCRNDAAVGVARLFVIQSRDVNAEQVEADVRESMAKVTGDGLWSKLNQIKTLLLEHHMAARRLGFTELFRPLYLSEHRAALLRGDLPLLRFFTELLLPLVEFGLAGEQFRVAEIMRTHSPLLDEQHMSSAGSDQLQCIRNAKVAVTGLLDLWSKESDPPLALVLEKVHSLEVFSVPDVLKPFVETSSGSVSDQPETSEEVDEDPADESVSDSTSAIRQCLGAPFSQLRRYRDYVAQLTAFDTHQGVKGREFDRVMVVINDEEARGFTFKYENLLGASVDQPSKSKKKTDESKESSEDVTRRLFYVTCSRSKGSLAVVAYTKNCDAVRNHAITKRWFEDSEIEVLTGLQER